MTTEHAELFQYSTSRGSSTTQAIIEKPGDALLGLDFDGTLAPIVPRPEDARPHPESMAHLQRLLGHIGAVAIITGRPVDVVLQLGGFAQLRDTRRLRIFGQYGVETWNGATGHISVPPTPPAISTAQRQIERMLADLDAAGEPVHGVALEDKGLAIGVHTRRAVAPEQAYELLEPRLRNLADRLGLVAEPGRNVVELRASSTDKGDVLRSALDRKNPRCVAFCGDDRGDLAAFASVDQWRSSSRPGARVVSYSREVPELASQADVLCQGPDGIAAWLGYLADQIETRSGSKG